MAGQLCELSLQLGAVRFAEVFRGQPLSEEAGQSVAPVGVMTDDPGGGLFQQRIGRKEQGCDRFRLQATAIHLIERNERGAVE